MNISSFFRRKMVKSQQGSSVEKNDYSLPTSLRYLKESQKEQNLPLKVSIIIATIIHMLLLWIVFPSKPVKVLQPEMKPIRMAAIRSFKLLPPAGGGKPKKGVPIAKKKKYTIPIPDPTPDEPEPVVLPEEDVVFSDTSDVDTEYEFGVPEGVPGGRGFGGEGPYRPGGNVTPPELLKQVDPVYPDEARKARIEGDVVLEAIVDIDGKPVQMRVLQIPAKGYGFEESAIEAVKQWKFRPGMRNGKPVPVIFSVIVHFTIS